MMYLLLYIKAIERMYIELENERMQSLMQTLSSFERTYKYICHLYKGYTLPMQLLYIIRIVSS
jgi:hypothetical protein